MGKVLHTIFCEFFIDIFLRFVGMVMLLVGVLTKDNQIFLYGLGMLFLYSLNQMSSWMGHYTREIRRQYNEKDN